MEHTEQCIKKTEVTAAAIKEFDAKYPNHCRPCGAQGGHADSEDVAGDGGSRMPTFEPCEKCVCEGKCPLCGEAVDCTDDQLEICTKCGWHYQNGPFAPTPYECYCYELNEIDKSEQDAIADDLAEINQSIEDDAFRRTLDVKNSDAPNRIEL